MTGPRDTLYTERLDLEWLTLDDAALMLEIWNDPGFLRYVGDRGIRTIDDAKAAITAGPLSLYAEHGYGPYRMTLRESGAAVGICGLFRRDYLDDPDIGFAVLPAHCRQGLALEAARAVIEHARQDLGLRRLTAIVSPGNAASIALIEKLGLRFESMIHADGDENPPVSLYAVDWQRRQ